MFWNDYTFYLIDLGVPKMGFLVSSGGYLEGGGKAIRRRAAARDIFNCLNVFKSFKSLIGVNDLILNSKLKTVEL